MGKEYLSLDIRKKCGDEKPCDCTKIGNITASKKASDPKAIGFIALVHESLTPFTISKNLDNVENLEDGPIYGVTKASVYYWEKDDGFQNPLLLAIIKNNNENQQYYFIKYDRYEHETQGDAGIWRHGPSVSSLQERLDDRNCVRNKVIPLDLERPDKHLNFTSHRLIGVRIKSTSTPQTLPGTNYTVKNYGINNGTKISRVIYNGVVTKGIDFKNQKIYTLRLFYSPANHKKPLLIEVWKENGDFEYYTTKGDNTWTSFGDFNRRLEGEPLEQKLDELTCEYYNAVTINLSFTNSTRHANNDVNNTYCCSGSHGSKRIYVTKREIKVNSELKTSYYEHSITGGFCLAHIYYNNGGRKNVKPFGLTFPIYVNSVHTIYYPSSPILIYVEGKGQNKWYQRKSLTSHVWENVPDNLKGLKPEDIQNTNCLKWNKLVEVLRSAGCNDYEECKDPPAKASPQQPTTGTSDLNGDANPHSGYSQPGVGGAGSAGGHTLSSMSGSEAAKVGASGAGALPYIVETYTAKNSYGQDVIFTKYSDETVSGVLSLDQGTLEEVQEGLPPGDRGSPEPTEKPQAKEDKEIPKPVPDADLDTNPLQYPDGKPPQEPQEKATEQRQNIGTESHESYQKPVVTSDQSSNTQDIHSEDTTSESETAALVETGLTVTVATLGIGSAFGISSGTLAGAGGLTGFGWWVFKRSRGDPWVIVWTIFCSSVVCCEDHTLLHAI
ncbi:hypothetical protein BEWA_001860 [Theileria equi strain WA]|uniref:Uncharacterized protein n=1 Tax=Theileria equi strain WA TaxID=1537102 RepID=L0B0W4_THEEQ|nr:hypothetical protein BEWA_001860 [Theileria equi strain WA]AFZ80779.1 hypothetical protein BEWA_001860 [Theileria equi strain WA]|eukprot:XP_004830445.1 hypothetical protein BEWA_001860 [Theileria equi strain WA]